MNRIGAALTAVLISAAGIGSVSSEMQQPLTANAEVDENGYDLSGFGWRFPEAFSKDDTVTVTENSYKSHDVSIEMSTYISPYLSGDLNGDRAVTLEDVVICCKYLAEMPDVAVTEASLRNADCNLNGLINAEDVRQMLGYLGASLTASEFFAESSQVYHVADIYIRYAESFRGAFAEGTFPPKGSCQFAWATDVAAETNALLLINADYVECRSSGIIYRNGVHYRDIQYREDVCILYDDGVMDILSANDYFALSDEEKSHIWQTSNFHLGLVEDGVQQSFAEIPNSTNILSTHPRSSIGYYEPGHYCFVQVDGRQPGYATGMYLTELAAVYADLGVQEAYNLDGGSSSSIVFNGSLYNLPSPVHEGETVHGRPTSDFFYICEPSQIMEDTAAIAWGDTPAETS